MRRIALKAGEGRSVKASKSNSGTLGSSFLFRMFELRHRWLGSLHWLCWLVWGRQVKNKKLGRDHATLSPLSSYRNPKPGMMLTLQAQGKEQVVILRDKGQGWSRGSFIFNKFINDIERVSFRGAVFIQLEISYEKQKNVTLRPKVPCILSVGQQPTTWNLKLLLEMEELERTKK